MNINKVYLVGNLVKDPEVRSTHSGKTVVRILIAASRDHFSREQNRRVRETDFIDVQAWGRPGELIAQNVKKGQPIFIEGRLKLEAWETPEGEKRSKLVVHCEAWNAIREGSPGAPQAPVGGPPEGFVEAPAGEGAATAPAGGGADASGKRRRRRRRGPRREGAPGAPAPAGGAPTGGAPAPTGGESPRAADTASSAPAPTPPPLPPAPPSPPPPPPAPATRKADPAMKEDMPF